MKVGDKVTCPTYRAWGGGEIPHSIGTGTVHWVDGDGDAKVYWEDGSTSWHRPDQLVYEDPLTKFREMTRDSTVAEAKEFAKLLLSQEKVRDYLFSADPSDPLRDAIWEVMNDYNPTSYVIHGALTVYDRIMDPEAEKKAAEKATLIAKLKAQLAELENDDV